MEGRVISGMIVHFVDHRKNDSLVAKIAVSYSSCFTDEFKNDPCSYELCLIC